jgi:HK97 gp10 family phage protein
MAANPLEGSAALIKKLKDMGALDDGKALRAAVKAGMKPVLQTARLLAPASEKAHKTYKGDTVEPGFGRKSLHIVTITDKTKQTATAMVGPTKRAFYMTQFVERGTSRMPAHPFLRPALFLNQDTSQAAVVKSLREYLEKVAAKP